MILIDTAWCKQIRAFYLDYYLVAKDETIFEDHLIGNKNFILG